MHHDLILGDSLLELAGYSLSPLVAAAMAAGTLVAGVGTLGFLRLRTRGRLCPNCGSTTVSLVPSFPLSLFRGKVLSRWCSGCEWTGLSFRPSHERRAADGRIHLGKGFKWGSVAAPPPGFFSWQGEEEPRGQNQEAAEMSPEAEPPPFTPTPPPLFQWKDDPPPPAQDSAPPPLPFRFAGEGPPPLPFRFAEEEPPGTRGREGEPPPVPFVFAEEEDQAPIPRDEEPPRIPFRFAGQGEPGGRSRSPRRIRPRLGFRWGG